MLIVLSSLSVLWRVQAPALPAAVRLRRAEAGARN